MSDAPSTSERAPRTVQHHPRQVALPGAAANQRRGGLLILGVVLVIGAAFGFWLVFASIDDRQSFLMTARTIERWEVVNQGDFTAVEASLGTASALTVDQVGSLVGKWSSGRIPASTLVTEGMFGSPPLSSELEIRKVLIQVQLPPEDAPMGTLQSGDTIALLGATAANVGDVQNFDEESPTELIGKLTLDFVRDDGTIVYLVTPEDALTIETTVRRYTGAADRRIWKLGLDVTTDDLKAALEATYGSLAATAPDAFTNVGVGAEPIEDLS